MITQATKHNNKISVSTAAGTRMVGNRLITGKAGTTTVCRKEITEIEDGVLSDDATIDDARSVLADYVLAGDLSGTEVEAILSLYPKWEDVKVGAWITAEKDDGSANLMRYKDTLYEVQQDHWKQADYTPDKVASLFTKATPENVIPKWVKPLYGTMAYDKGEQVTHDNPQDDGNIWIYESTYNGNTTEPGRDGIWDRYWKPIERVQ